MALQDAFTSIHVSKTSNAEVYRLLVQDHLRDNSPSETLNVECSFFDVLGRLRELHDYGLVNFVNPQKGDTTSFLAWRFSKESDPLPISGEERGVVGTYITLHNDVYNAIGDHPYPKELHDRMIRVR